MPFVVGRLALDVERTLQPDRVTVGDRAVAVVKVTNPRRARSPRARSRSTSAGGRCASTCRRSAPGRSTEAVYPLPTARRGVVDVGPALIVKADLLGLMRREIVQTGTQTLWVHPRVTALAPLPVGFAKDLEGPTSDASPAGDVAFHALREYELGDDHRHIHWMSSARTGTLMVRHHVDNRRPNLTVVVDTEAPRTRRSASSTRRSRSPPRSPSRRWSAASRCPCTSTARSSWGTSGPASRTSVLDRLTLADGAEGTDVGASALRALRAEAGTSALVVVTGNVAPERFLAMASVARRSARVILVRVWPAGDRLPGVAARRQGRRRRRPRPLPRRLGAGVVRALATVPQSGRDSHQHAFWAGSSPAGETDPAQIEGRGRREHRSHPRRDLGRHRRRDVDGRGDLVPQRAVGLELRDVGGDRGDRRLGRRARGEPPPVAPR